MLLYKPVEKRIFYKKLKISNFFENKEVFFISYIF
jgi:hypothetical protein